jgi:hypothetical protein
MAGLDPAIQIQRFHSSEERVVSFAGEDIDSAFWHRASLEAWMGGSSPPMENGYIISSPWPGSTRPSMNQQSLPI